MKERISHFLNKLRHDRRGVALELALLLLVVTFALSTLVLTTSLLQHSKKLGAEKTLTQGIALEQIGADFCAAASAGEWTEKYPDYTITVDGLTLTVTAKDSEEVLLTVELTRADGRYTVTKWQTN